MWPSAPISLIGFFWDVCISFSAGLRPGDIITRINDKDIGTAAEVYSAVSSTKELRLTVHRGLDLLYLTVVPERFE